MIESGQPAPDFTLPATGNQEITLSDLRSSKVVLYFYPRDNTPGCTTEGQDFRDHYAEFKKLNIIILGVSRDSIKTHENFKSRHQFPFELISDNNEIACKLYDVIKEKTCMAKRRWASNAVPFSSIRKEY